MRGVFSPLLLIVVVLPLTAGCATREEWEVWKQNPSHFASMEHFQFSVKNRTGARARVTRDDLDAARAQRWFGQPITVSQEEILER